MIVFAIMNGGGDDHVASDTLCFRELFEGNISLVPLGMEVLNG